MATSSKLHEVGRGVMVKHEGNILTLTVDLSQRNGPSKTGKTVVVASTNGIVKGPEGVSYGFNAFIKP
jgi:hypothetical protein